MADDDALNAALEMRRRSRGVEPALVHHVWRRRLAVWGSIVVLLLLIAGAAWAWYAYTHVPTLSARVRAPVVQLSAEVDARLLELHVDEKQEVQKGQVVARLDDTEMQAALKAVEATRTIRQSAYEQAKANKVVTEAEIASDIAMATARVAVAKARLQSQETAIEVRQKRLPQEIRQASARHDKALADFAKLKAGARTEDIETARARIESAKATLKLYELEVEQSRQLVDEGIDSQYTFEVRRTRLQTQQNALREAELELERLLAGPTEEEVQAAAKAVEEQAASLAIAKLQELDLDALRTEKDIRAAELRESEARLSQAKARQAEVAIAEQQVLAAKAELDKAEAEVAGRRAALGTMEIRSPVDGIVVRVFADVGEVCRKGIPIILVSDASKERWIDAFVDEEDAMLVDIGQKATVRVPANSSYTVEAVVEQVGLHTQSLDATDTNAQGGGPRFGQPDRVWIMLVPVKPLPEHTVTGTTARGVIRVR
jgi:multidrug resistance efflux pump